MERRVLGGYNFRGKVQPIRLMLADASVDYTEQNEMPDDITIADQEFIDELPWYLDGIKRKDKTHRKYMKIVWYIADKYDMVGTDEFEIGRIKTTEVAAENMRNKWEKLMYGSKKTYEERKIRYKEKLEENLSFLSKFLDDEIWFAGLTLTYVDFLLYELFDINKVLFPDCLDPHPNLIDFMVRILNRTRIANFLKTDRILKFPINSPFACAFNKIDIVKKVYLIRNLSQDSQDGRDDDKNGREDDKNGRDDDKNGRDDDKNGREDDKNGRDDQDVLAKTIETVKIKD